jgi:hypothetical protein
VAAENVTGAMTGAAPSRRIDRRRSRWYADRNGRLKGLWAWGKMAYDIRPLSLAEVLDRGFRVLRDHLRLLVGIAAWAWIPYGVLLALSESNKIYAGLAMLVFLIVSPLMYAALIIAVGEVYLDQPATISSAYRSTRALVVPIIGTFLLLYVLVALALLAFIIPGIYFMVCWALVTPVMIVERRFGIAALRRSRELVKGAWGRTFAILFVAGLIASVPGGMLKVYWMLIPYLGAILNAAMSAVTSTYSAVVLVIYYFDRRCRVEEFDLHFLARQIRAEGEAGTPTAVVAGTSTIA